MRTEIPLAACGLGVFLAGMKGMTEGLRTLVSGTRSPARGALFGAEVLAFPQAPGRVSGANFGATITAASPPPAASVSTSARPRGSGRWPARAALPDAGRRRRGLKRAQRRRGVG